MSYQETMNMPIKSFWSLNKQISRIRSDEALASMELYCLGNMGSEKLFDVLKDKFIKGTDNFVTMTQPPQEESYKDGIDSLRAIHEKIHGKR